MTVPEPVPDLVTEREYTEAVKVAVTEVLPVTLTTQVPVPEQPPPDHPEKTEPPLAEAVSVTLVPELYDSEQSAPQLMPAGLEVTVPEPVPDLVTVRGYVIGVQVPFQVVPAVQVAVAVAEARKTPLL